VSLIRKTVSGLRRLFTRRARGLVIALGSGGAAGIAHVGVFQVLAENDIPVRAIAGTSIGAEIGAFIAAGLSPDEVAEIARSFDWKQTAKLFLPDFPDAGLISGTRIVEFLNRGIGLRRIEDLEMGYVAVAANIDNGELVVIGSGDVVNAVRASISIPGILSPYHSDGRALVDGGVLNPVPFDVARERFGGPVVAVAVHTGSAGFRPPVAEPSRPPQWPAYVRQLLRQPWMTRAPGLRVWLETQLENHRKPTTARPYWSTRRVLDRVYTMAIAELVRLRALRSPPDLVLTPDVSNIGLLEFYRAEEAIAAGRRAAEEALPRLRQLLANG
jgi:NTE family protein